MSFTETIWFVLHSKCNEIATRAAGKTVSPNILRSAPFTPPIIVSETVLLQYAFEVAEKELDIPIMLDANGKPTVYSPLFLMT